MKHEKSAKEIKEEAIKEVENELERSIVKRDEKMDELKKRMINRFDSVRDAFKTISGYVGVVEAEEKLDMKLAHSDRVAVMAIMVDDIDAMKNKYMEVEDTASLDTFLDQFINSNIHEDAPAGRNLVVCLLTMDACNELWQVMRMLPEFEQASNDAIKDMEKKLEELRA